MRLQEMKQIIGTNIEKIEYESKPVSNTTNYEIKGHMDLINAINEIASIGFLDEELEELKKLSTIYYDRSLESLIQVNNSTFVQFKNIVTRIIDKCNTVYSAIDIAVPNQTQFSVSVKLPNFKELDSLPKFFSSLDKALNQALVNEHIDGKVTIEAFDSGSFWVVLSVGSALALKFLGKLTDCAAKVSSLIFDIEKEKLQMEKMTDDNNFLKQFKEIQMERLKLLVKTEADALASDFDITDPEYIGRLQLSIKEIGNLLTEGTQIKPNEIAPPEEIKNFPDYTQINSLIEKHIRLLEEQHKSNGTENENTIE